MKSKEEIKLAFDIVFELTQKVDYTDVPTGPEFETLNKYHNQLNTVLHTLNWVSDVNNTLIDFKK